MSKKSTLQQWLKRKQEKKAATADTQTSNRPADAAIPLSYGQQQLWLLQQLHGANPFYHYAETYHLKGPLEVEHLVNAYQFLVKRHTILRTVFTEVNGQVQQEILPEAAFVLQKHNISDLPAEARQAAQEKICQEEASAPFDLEQGPLSRLIVIQLGAQEHLLLFVLHHIITDKWSMRVLREELSTVYQQLLNGQTPELPTLPLQYADFAYQEQHTPVNKTHLDYWTNQLANSPALLELPLDYPRPASPSFKGQYLEQVLSLELSEKLRQLSKSLDTTLFVLMLSAYKVLLSRYAQQEDILVGTPITNRKKQSLEQLIGFFNETTVLRDSVTKDRSFSDLVQAVKDTTLAAFDHNSISFETLVKTLNPDRQSNINPIFQAMFILHVVPPKPTFNKQIDFSVAPFDLGTTKFDLTLYVSDGEPQLRTLFEFATDLFSPATIKRMQGHLRVLLEAIVSDPQQLVGQLPLLTKEETNDLLAPAIPITTKANHILDYFTENVKQNPAQPAVSYQGQSLTYEQLNEQANLIAQRIRSQTEQRNPLIGLYTERSLDMIVGLIAILKANGAYVPLDPDYPAERIKFMIEDAGLQLVLSHHAVAEQLSSFTDLEVLLIDDIPAHAPQEQLIDLERSPEDIAYLIYTSGSSGQPKGVVISQANLIHSTAARLHYYPTTPKAFLLLSSFAFDSSVAGIFWTLCTSGKLVLTPKRIEQDLEKLATIIAEESVSHTLLLPSLYEAVLKFIDTEKLVSLRTVIVAGEACSKDLCEEHFALLPITKLYNEYGPTEATVWCTAHEIKQDNLKNVVPIGQAIPGTDIYLLNEDHALQPIGVPGELYVGGPGVAAGYWQRPELTKERFVQNPFSTVTTQQLYRTGDLARYQEDGTLQFLGRADQQIKFRGFRIELGEIRAGINHFVGVTDSVVVVDQEQRRLVAYLVTTSQILDQDLTFFLKERFPDYMVPTLFMQIDEIPHLPNGKVNLRALPTPKAPVREQRKDTSTPPESKIATKLIKIWEEVLLFEGVRPDDNFFEIGGDSILSIQIVAKARKAGIQLAPNAIFNHQTIAELARVAEDLNAGGDNQPTEFPLSPGQWHFLTNEHPTSAFSYGRFTLSPNTDLAKLRKASQQLLKEEAVLRLAFQQKAEKWVQFVQAEGATVEILLMSDLEEVAQNDLLNEALSAWTEKADLAKGQLFKIFLLQKTPPASNELVMIGHQLLLDQTSWSLLVQQLATLYQNGEDKQKDEPLSKNYRSWVEQIQQWGSEQKFADQLSFWQTQKAAPLLSASGQQLPVAASSYSKIQAQLTTEETQSLLNEVQTVYQTTTAEILLLAYCWAIVAHNELDTLAVGIKQDAREAIKETIDWSDGEPLGHFGAFFPLSIPINRSASISELIVAFKEHVRSVPSRGLGYNVLAQHSEQGGTLAKTPDILFQHHDLSIAPNELFLAGPQLFKNMSNTTKEGQQSFIWKLVTSFDNGQLTTAWHYSSLLHQEGTVAKLLGTYQEKLRLIIQHCKEQTDVRYTPSDFTELDMNQSDLDNLLSQIDL